MKEYKPSERNYEGIQFGSIRQKVDPDYNKVHDELSKAYYEKTPFRDTQVYKNLLLAEYSPLRNMGILDKETFDKLHGFIEMKRQIVFAEAHAEESKIDPTLKEHGIDVAETQTRIVDFQKEGIDIKI